MLHCPTNRTKRWLVGLVVLAALMETGCVRRRLMIRSNPPGAMVYVDNQPIGTTPCATDFIYYGTREIRLVKAGYETLTVNQPLPAPWYQIAPLDFVSENLVPHKIQDYRTASYNLVPQVIVPNEQLIARGEQLRQSTLQGAVVPAGGAVPIAPMGPPQPAVSGPGQPLFTAPNLGQPTLAPPVTAPTPTLAPALSGETLPLGGQPVEALPAPR